MGSLRDGDEDRRGLGLKSQNWDKIAKSNKNEAENDETKIRWTWIQSQIRKDSSNLADWWFVVFGVWYLSDPKPQKNGAWRALECSSPGKAGQHIFFRLLFEALRFKGLDGYGLRWCVVLCRQKFRLFCGLGFQVLELTAGFKSRGDSTTCAMTEGSLTWVFPERRTRDLQIFTVLKRVTSRGLCPFCPCACSIGHVSQQVTQNQSVSRKSTEGMLTNLNQEYLKPLLRNESALSSKCWRLQRLIQWIGHGWGEQRALSKTIWGQDRNRTLGKLYMWFWAITWLLTGWINYLR